MVDANWLPDPSGTHELRYWNGTAWTEHVSDQGTTGVDVPTRELPLPGEAPPPPPPAPGDTNVLYYGSNDAGFAAPPSSAPAAAKPSWKDRLKQVADQGKAVAEQGKAKLAEQSAKRTEQWANDPTTLWAGESKGGATGAAGVAKARYRITADRVWIESGLLGTRTESVPLWAIRDMDIRQAVWQRGKDVGDLVLGLDDPAYGVQQSTFDLNAVPEPGRTSGQVVLDNIESPQQVYDFLAPLVSDARHRKTVERQSQYVHHVTPPQFPGAPQPAAPAAAPAPDPIEQLRRLGELRDAGILTEEEFAAQKAKLLG
ncbi:PH domain-containing protein [Blastococcus sp. URHD0036]|uniref:PH domain-containing protein n=1 Tax=Blastococcus sp. URHD0036 TaxID=1380356 RepID=UPI000553F69A|nr:PH domain-containing protein [Blastococcus sp. URHD0036]